MKESLEKKFVEQTITEEELLEYKKSLWIKKGIISGIYLFMMIFSFIYIKRIGVFFNALGGGGFSFSYDEPLSEEHRSYIEKYFSERGITLQFNEDGRSFIMR